LIEKEPVEDMNPVLGLAPLKPDLGRGLGELVLQVAKESTVPLTNLKALD